VALFQVRLNSRRQDAKGPAAGAAGACAPAVNSYAAVGKPSSFHSVIMLRKISSLYQCVRAI